MNHTHKYHLATEHQELEYKKQLEWAFSAQLKQDYPENNFLVRSLKFTNWLNIHCHAMISRTVLQEGISKLRALLSTVLRRNQDSFYGQC